MTKRLNKTQIADRRRKVADWALEGWSQERIAAALDVSQATVCRDLEVKRREWREASIRDFNELRAEQLHKLDLVEAEAWAAWRRSQQPVRSASIVETEKGTKKVSSLKHGHGDRRFLDEIRKCVADRCELVGMEPPPRPVPPVQDPFENFDNLPPEQQGAVIRRILDYRNKHEPDLLNPYAPSWPGNTGDSNQPRDTSPDHQTPRPAADPLSENKQPVLAVDQNAGLGRVTPDRVLHSTFSNQLSREAPLTPDPSSAGGEGNRISGAESPPESATISGTATGRVDEPRKPERPAETGGHDWPAEWDSPRVIIVRDDRPPPMPTGPPPELPSSHFFEDD